MRGKVLVLSILVLAGCAKPDNQLQQESGVFSIVNGSTVTTANTYSKHTVFLQMTMAEGGGICTGSIYDSETILTAAHCLVGAKEVLIAFANDLQEGELTPDQIRQVDIASIYPKFRPQVKTQRDGPVDPAEPATSPIPKVPTVDEVVTALDNANEVDYDVAVLHFKGGLPQGYSPVTLASSPAVVQKGAMLHMIGYGLARVASKMAVVNGRAGFIPMPDQKTSGILRETQVAIDRYDTKIGMIFTDSRTTGVCSGDSGGPAFVNDASGNPVQVGIAEAVATPFCNSVSMHTAVFPFLPWIQKMAEAMAEKSNEASNALMF